MTERLTGVLILLLASIFIAFTARAGEALYFDNAKVETEQQNLDEVRELRKIRSEVDTRVHHLFVVQFNSAIQLSDRLNLETLKAEVISYIPDDALVIKATPKVAQTIRMSSPNVRLVMPYDPSWKISSDLPLPSVLTKDQLVDANVKFSSEKDANHSLQQVQSLPETEIVSVTNDQVTVRTSPINIAPISTIDTVVWIASVLESAVTGEANKNKEKEITEYLVEKRKFEAPSHTLVSAALKHTNGETLNLSKALIIDEVRGIAAGEQHVYPINVNEYGKLKVTLYYNDREFSPVAGKPLANDLDVVIVDPSGDENALNDRSQPFEHIEFGARKGPYEVRVKGVNVPAGKQTYSLLVSIE